MPWLKLDDEMGEHRKTKRVLRTGGLQGLAAFGLHSLGLLYSARYLTDGHVERDMVDETMDLARVRERDRSSVISALEAGTERMPALWVPAADGGWEIHDYLEYNPTRADVIAQRKRDAERKARGRKAQAEGDVRPDTGRTDAGLRAVSDGPVPTRPVPTTPLAPRPAGGRARDRQRWEDNVAAWAQHIFPDGPSSTAVTCVRQAAGQGARDAGAVIDFAKQWFPDLVTEAVA